MPWLFAPASGWTYRILYTNADNRTNSITATNKSNGKTGVFEGARLKDLTDALVFTPSHPVTFHDDNDSSVQYVLIIQYKDGSSEELSIVKCPAILYKGQYLSVDLYALELIQEENDN